jgi:outer membrane protein OmpA-like peptidoglycan-associated protein
MNGLRRVAFVAALLAPSLAQAQAEVGAFVGPRIFADEAQLGFIKDAPAHPSLGSSVMFGGRIAYPLLSWLVPEAELALSPTSTSAEGGASSANVFWLDPRLHIRFMLTEGKRLQPFVVVGGGSPIALSSARMTFDSGIVWAGYVGGGVRFDTYKGFSLRFDARVAFVPGARFVSDNEADPYLKTEIDVGLGVEFHFGRKRPTSGTKEKPGEPLADNDKDGVANEKDGCPDRPEDHDGFDDLDGCPDIDNDADRVLDIADRCNAAPETFNGFQDDDGCPDSLPPEVDALKGTIEGLIYAEAETVVRNSAMANIKKIAATMSAHPSIRVVLVGHTDDREAKQFAEPVDGQAPDVAAVAIDLAKARAEAVRQVLASNGVTDGRIVVEGRGAEEPVTENDKPKGRLANRRVEIKLFVPKI